MGKTFPLFDSLKGFKYSVWGEFLSLPGNVWIKRTDVWWFYLLSHLSTPNLNTLKIARMGKEIWVSRIMNVAPAFIQLILLDKNLQKIYLKNKENKTENLFAFSHSITQDILPEGRVENAYKNLLNICCPSRMLFKFSFFILISV